MLKNKEEKLASILGKIKEEHEADGIKVYFVDEENYTFKVIKEEKIVHRYRKGTKRQNYFDLRKAKNGN